MRCRLHVLQGNAFADFGPILLGGLQESMVKQVAADGSFRVFSTWKLFREERTALAEKAHPVKRSMWEGLDALDQPLAL